MHLKSVICCTLFLCLLTFAPELCFGDRKPIYFGAFFHHNNPQAEAIFESKVNYLNNKYEDNFVLQPTIDYINPIDSFRSTKLACSMSESGVATIITPPNEDCAGVISSIGGNLDIPTIQLHWESTTADLARKLAVRLYPSVQILSEAYVDIIKSMDWPGGFTILYQHDEALIRLQAVLEAHKSFDSVVTVRQLFGNDHRTLLKELQTSGERYIILDCDTDKIMELLNQAKEVRMTGEYVNYFITNLDTHTVNFENLYKSMSNITIVSLVNSSSFYANQLMNSWDTVDDEVKKNVHLTPETIPTDMALYYDAVEMFYRAIIKAEINSSLEINRIQCNLGQLKWKDGKRLYEFLKNVEFEGLTGPIGFNANGVRTQFRLQILDLTVKGFQLQAVWDPDKKITDILTPEEKQAQYSQGIQTKVFRVASRIGAPYLMWKNTSAEGNDRFEGFSMDLIDAIAKQLGYKYEFYLVADGQYGTYNKETKKWNGLIKDLLERQADLAICDLTITYERRSAVDFTMPFMTLGISILYRKPVQQPPALFSFMEPLSLEVWLYMAVAFLGVALTQYFIARMCPKDWENPTPQDPNPPEVLENIWSFKNCIWLAFGSVMCQGCDILPKGSSSRASAGFWWFFALIVIQSYIANLTAYLTMQRMDNPIESAEDLAKQTKVKYGTIKKGSTNNFFRESNHSVYKKMWSVMESTRPSVFAADNNEGVERVQNGKGLYAYLMESTSLEYNTERKCELTSIGGKLDSKGYGIAMPVNSPYRTNISGAILKLQEGGKLQLIKNKWWKEMYGGGACPVVEEEANANEMGIENVGGIFIVLIFGCIASFSVTLFEFLWNIRTIAVEHKITPSEALISELRFAIQIFNKEKPAKPYCSPTPSTTSKRDDDDDDDDNSDGDARSVGPISVLRSASSFLRLDGLVEKKVN